LTDPDVAKAYNIAWATFSVGVHIPKIPGVFSGMREMIKTRLLWCIADVNGHQHYCSPTQPIACQTWRIPPEPTCWPILCHADIPFLFDESI
jgi:hypothetical protein